MIRNLVIVTLAAAAVCLAQGERGREELERENTRDQVEPRAGRWKTWVLSSGRELRLPPPPHETATRAELNALKDLIEDLSPAEIEQARYWDAGSPPYRWIELLSDRMRSGRLGVSPMSFRSFGLLSVAMYDATIAAWDSKYAYDRPRPRFENGRVRPLVATPRSPSYPSEHAVVAGAAATVLAYLFPAEAAQFEALAEQAGHSRVLAGVQYPTDVTAGLELGRAVGRKVVEYARGDRTDTVWTGTVPTGPGLWVGTNPGFVTAPQWKPWFLASGAEFRPAPPPAYNSAQRAAELAEIKNFARTFNTNASSFFWQTVEGVHTWFFSFISQRLFETGLDANPPRAARAYALMGVLQFDTMIASNDGKFTYWMIRPSQQDTSIVTLFPPPNFPSYPANHASLSSARAELLAYLFPQDAALARAKGEEAGLSRIWAGIHFRSDIDSGVTMGRAIAQKLIALAEDDGSER